MIETPGIVVVVFICIKENIYIVLVVGCCVCDISKIMNKNF